MSEIFLEVNGIRYKGFTEITINKSIENFAGTFQFSTTLAYKEETIKLQDEVVIFINNDKIMTGFIESLNLGYSARDHSISISGREKTGDLIDSSIKQKTYLQTDFVKLINIVLSDNEQDFKIINNVGSLIFDKGTQIRTENNESIFDFLDRYAKKLQVILITDNEGNIVITREGTTNQKGSLINKIKDGHNNNILSANIDLSTKDRYYEVIVCSQLDNQTYTKNSISQKATAFDSNIRQTRKKIINQTTASKTITLQDLAKWNINIRRAKGSRYNCAVQDYYSLPSLAKDIWAINQLVNIKDEICKINGEFLIQEVSFKKSLNGSFTDLTIVERGANSLEGVNQSFGKSFITV